MPTIPVDKLVTGVTENGDFLVFYVESSQPGHDDYRVDKEKFCGHGDCDCDDFRVALRADAEPLLLQGYEGMKEHEAFLIGPWRRRLAETGEWLVHYYEVTQQPEKARMWREKLSPE